MKTMKKFFASLLVLCMVLAMPNMAALADDATPITLGENVTTSIEEGDSVGKVYSYTIPANVEGTYALTVEVSAATEGAYWQIDLVNTTNEAYPSGQAATTEWESNLSASVKGVAGDVITITVKPYAIYEGTDEATGMSIFTYNAVDVTWSTSGVTVGTKENPEAQEMYDNYGNVTLGGDAIVTPGSEGYYYSFTAQADGNLGIYLNAYACSPSEELKPEIIITNKTTEKVTKYSDGLTKISVASPWGSSVYEVVLVPVAVGDELLVQVKSDATVEGNAVVSWSAVVAGEPGSEASPVPVDPSYTKEEPLTVKIPAGGIYNFSGAYELQGYSITISGETYNLSFFGNEPETIPENGVYEAAIQLMRGQLAYTIENTSDAEKTYTIYVTAPLGSAANPDEIEFEDGKTSGSKEHEFTYNDANYNGKYEYVYKWVASEDGYVRLTVSANTDERVYPSEIYVPDTDEWVDLVINEEIWKYAAYNQTADDGYVSSFSKETEDGMKVLNGELIAVSKGDVVIIELQALDAESGVWVDSTIEAKLEYVDFATGSEESAIKDIENHLPDTDDEGNPVEVPATVILLDKDGNISGVITKEILEAAKENGVDIAFGVAEDVVWVIDAASLGDALTDLDLSVGGEVAIPEDMVSAIVGENDGYTISIAHDGALGLDAILGLILGDENCDYTGMYANLFYYNETTGGLEFQDAYEMEDGHTAVFEMTHASDYVIVMTEEAMSADDNIVPETPGDDTIEGTGDFSSTMIYVIVLLGAALVGAGFVAKKRFA
ncbi:MAG: hypothetical protein J6B96_04620 [Agathobacter sp.]|nr:hypothetical protein [Agathobacter sp.]